MTGNHKYGNAEVGERAIKAVQRYASKLSVLISSIFLKEYCFNQIKQFLQLHELLAMNEREVAIGEVFSHITIENSAGYCRKCGSLV